MFTRLLQRFRRPAAGLSWLEPDELRQRLRRGEMQLNVDVRGPEEFDGPLGHIAGALNIPLAALAGRTAVLASAGCPIVLVCLTDKRSSQAATELAAVGVRDVAVLRGGMRAWGGA